MRNNVKRFIPLVLALSVIFSISSASGVYAETTRLTIIHSSNLNGYLLSCRT